MATKARSRRSKPEVFKNKNGLEIEFIYCRKCMQNKKPNDYYQATDLYLDSNLFMSVCRNCISEMYVMNYKSERSMDMAIYKTCRTLNIKFDNAAIDATKLHIEKQNKLPDDSSCYGIYKAKLVSVQKTFHNENENNDDLTFHEPMSLVSETPMESDEFEGAEDLKDFWGSKISSEDISFLEKQLVDWKKSFSCSNKSEELILKELCYKELEKKKIRDGEASGSIDSILKSTQELLKNGGLTPAQATASSAGKTNDTWGTIIKQIEETTPAEFYKDKELFKDFDKLSYFKNMVIRALKNFVTFSKDFNISDDAVSESDDFDNIDLQSNEDITEQSIIIENEK